MLLASFVADCVFVVLAPHTENVHYVWPIKKLLLSLTSDVAGSKLLEACERKRQ
jgi:hypothetical protein